MRVTALALRITADHPVLAHPLLVGGYIHNSGWASVRTHTTLNANGRARVITEGLLPSPSG